MAEGCLFFPVRMEGRGRFCREESFIDMSANELTLATKEQNASSGACPHCAARIPGWWVRDYCANCGEGIPQTDSQTTTDQPHGLAAYAGDALIRICDVCGKVNAIDLDASLEAERDMQELDHTVKRVTREEAMEAWKDAGRCNHKSLVESLRAQLAAQNNRIKALESTGQNQAAQ